MGVFEKLVVGGFTALVGSGLIRAHRLAQEEKRRRNSPLRFDDRPNQQDFDAIVENAARVTPRLIGFEVEGLLATARVRSNTGMTEWSIEADFNDYGKLSGKYWLISENSQSPIPHLFATAIQREVEKCRRAQ